ncbi:MAG: 2-hydroxychromene-2-carboxylate isomerase [Pseudomonadota bacterium]
MTKRVEFCFDIVSPASYIAWHVLPKIAAAAEAELIYTPVFLGGIMQAQGNRPPGTVAAKGDWMRRDLARWTKLYDLPFQRNAVFPQNTLALMRGAVAYLGRPEFQPYCTAFFQAMHVDNREVQDQSVIAEILGELGIDGADFARLTGDQATKDALKSNTEDAVARGVFGAPSFFVGETMHFGQDRMWMVAEDLGVSLHTALDA